MPTISRFYGIVIFMNYVDHAPPHFHARYQNQEITVEIETGLIQGKMALRAMRMVMDWFEKYQRELADNWELARAHQPLKPVPPLA
jgi:hypothetical protein